MLSLRDYQREAVEAIVSDARKGVRRQLVALPTGAGKTILVTALSQQAHGRVLMLVHRDELVQQSVEKFGYVWPEEQVGVVKAERDEHDRQVVVGSIQTLQHRSRRERVRAHEFSLVIVDECHHAVSPSYRDTLEGLGFLPDPGAGRLLLGITATPMRGDGVGLGSVFEKIVYRRSIADLVRAGYLADVRGVRVSTKIDLSHVRLRHGDFQAKDLSLAVDTPRRNELIVDAYRKHGERRKAVVFTVDVAHAQHLAQAFRDGGFRADWVSGDLPLDERRERLRRFRSGEVEVLAACQLLIEGWDEPSVGCVVMARPTRSTGLYIQQVGRGLRPYPGKDYCVVIDVTDNAHDICALGSLGGEEFVSREPRRTVPAGEPVARDEPDETPATEVVVTPLDLLSRSKFKWRVERHRMVLEAGPGQDVVLDERGDDRWSVTLRAGQTRQPLSDQLLPITYAQGVAEDFVRENGLEGFASRDARWRTRPASEKQLSLLAKLGVAASAGLTREDAQALIRDTLRRRALEDPDAAWRAHPASDAQLAWMKSHGFQVPDGFTKGDFSNLMERLKRRCRA